MTLRGSRVDWRGVVELGISGIFFQNRIFTTNAVGWPGAEHISMESTADLDKLCALAKEMPGFTQEDEDRAPRKALTVGFGHNAILSHAGTVSYFLYQCGTQNLLVKEIRRAEI